MDNFYQAVQGLVGNDQNSQDNQNSQNQNQGEAKDTDFSQAVNNLVQSSPEPKSSDPWESFKQTAKQIIKEKGLPDAVLPVLLSQAAIESARGTAAPGNNYFGIKGQGTAGANNLATQEYGQGGYYGENSDFAAYNSPEDSINAYLNLIQGYRGVPEAIQSNNPDAIIRAIEANGYATSPTYVENVENTPEFRGE